MIRRYAFQINNQQGFVILFTILITAVIFTMGLGIYSIAIRQTILSSTAREATQAFYSADAGIECALLAESQEIITLAAGGSSGTVTCNNQSILIDGIGGTVEPFEVTVGAGSETVCASVNVFTGPAARRLIARGFNEECPTGANNPRLVERDLDITYAISN